MHFDGSDHQFVVALDTKTGKTLWRTERSIDYKDVRPDGTLEAEGDFRKAFATPQMLEVNGAPVIISTGSKATYGYDPMTGKELWRVEEREAFSGSTRPVIGHGLVFVPAGFPKGILIAIKPDGRGDATATHVAWRLERGVPTKPSLALVGDLLFMVTDAGVASAVEAKTGAVVWTARIGGSYSASPLVAGSRVYFFSEEGKTVVIDASRTFTSSPRTSSVTASWPRPRPPTARSTCGRARISTASRTESPADAAAAPPFSRDRRHPNPAARGRARRRRGRPRAPAFR